MANYAPNSLETLLLSTMMSRLQTRPPYLDTTSVISNACDRIISDDTKTPLQREEAKLEKAIVQIILSGEGPQKLSPNSGQAVSIGDHQVCVGFHEDPSAGFDVGDGAGPAYRIWEWHGHIMLHDDDEGYTAEYVYGNYFEKTQEVNQRARAKEEEEEPARGAEGLGLGGLIGGNQDETNARILCRNISAGSLRDTTGLSI
ncbi:uncharacterized protein LOC131069124 isoform X2 [Cryptomeria japonica]|uniref:uncharacterized protein LOC131069124 isoform X2 n=1 Tax=Cryptomeria japonica TaxID=3369 RepID=UPI0027DA1889|nr:uncharacterized protein LOC131069124 isoform X2 [Cryptomeria japonica]